MDVVQTMAVRTRFEAFMRALITPEISSKYKHLHSDKHLHLLGNLSNRFTPIEQKL